MSGKALLLYVNGDKKMPNFRPGMIFNLPDIHRPNAK